MKQLTCMGSDEQQMRSKEATGKLEWQVGMWQCECTLESSPAFPCLNNIRDILAHSRYTLCCWDITVLSADLHDMMCTSAQIQIYLSLRAGLSRCAAVTKGAPSLFFNGVKWSMGVLCDCFRVLLVVLWVLSSMQKCLSLPKYSQPYHTEHLVWILVTTVTQFHVEKQHQSSH